VLLVLDFVTAFLAFAMAAHT